MEGDPDHPVNEGSLCAKGASIFQLAENSDRIMKPRYRAPGSDKWEEKSWDWMLTEIAKRVKKTRDESFELKNAKGEEVNRITSYNVCYTKLLRAERRRLSPSGFLASMAKDSPSSLT